MKLKWIHVLIFAILVFAYVKGRKASEKEGIKLGTWENLLYGLRLYYNVNEDKDLSSFSGIAHPGYNEDPSDEMIDPYPYRHIERSHFPEIAKTMKASRPSFLWSKQRYFNEFINDKN